MTKDATTADRWQQVAEVYLAAVERDPADRDAFLREACEGDEGLRREVESLMGYEGATDPWIERPAAALAAPAAGLFLEAVRYKGDPELGPLRPLLYIE